MRASRILGLAAVAAVLVSCALPPPKDSAGVAQKVGVAIIAACPAADDAPQTAAQGRDACGEALARSGVLAAAAGPGMLWGGLAQGVTPADYDPAKNALTRLDTLVWAKLYLSLFEFTGGSSLATLANGDVLLELDGRLRPMAPEEFPYPFWHSADKWRLYHQARKVALLFRGGVLIAGYRDGIDPAIPVAGIKWDGKWQWQADGRTLPRASLYDYTLSHSNPERAALEDAYSQFEAAARPYNCNSCHNPANPRGINPLLFFTHPAQALAGRHEIVAQLKAGKMPPPGGIADAAARRQLIALAEKFAQEGDKALDYEKSRIAR